MTRNSCYTKCFESNAGTLCVRMAQKLPVLVIVGRPNVGKSTLFNRLAGQRLAVVEDTPGVTRDRLYSEGEWRGRQYTLVDTGGILFYEEDPLVEQIRIQAQVAMEEADVIVFLGDAEAGITPDDWELANRLRGIKTPVLVVVNKSDNTKRDAMANEFFELGLGEVYPVSALHGRGVAEVLDAAVDHFPPSEPVEKKDEIRLAIIGRPNVGKSSLLNAFCGEQRAIVSNIPGTTRDAIDTMLEYRGDTFRLIDTAGLRRRGKIQGSIEYYMAMRAQRAIERADCALVVMNGPEGLTDGDKRIAKIAHDAGRAVVFAVNKWDLIEPPDGQPRKRSMIKDDLLRIIHNELPEIGYARAVFTSAKESAGLEPCLDMVLQALDNYSFRIATGPLNRLIQEATYVKPLSRKGRQLKIYYATQVQTRPPTFALFCNEPDLVHFSYLRYLENKLREVYPLPGTQLRLLVRSSHKKDEK